MSITTEHLPRSPRGSRSIEDIVHSGVFTSIAQVRGEADAGAAKQAAPAFDAGP